LQDNGGSNLTISANGSFSFPTQIARGTSYNVTVLTQPSTPAQTCGVTNGYGGGLFGNVSNILVTCYTTLTTYTIGGTVSGLSGSGLVLQNNSGNNLAISANGSFTFTTPVASGSPYSVTVLTQPSSPSQNCVVAGGGGTASANITGIQVNCTTATFPISGTITGLTGAGLVLQDNGGDNLALSAGATNFTFATPVASGANYAVAVLTQPTGQTCTITNGSGTVGSTGVSNISISCVAATANVGVTVSGLLPHTSVVLQNNGADTLIVSADNGAAVNFSTPVAGGAAYAVTVLTQPMGATCVAGENASGTLAGAKVNVSVTCGNRISAGESHTCMVTGAGGVLCWGLNEYGQLGNGTTLASTSPVAVTSLASGVVSVAAGYTSTCALTDAGTVWCWGDNSSGQLGNGTAMQSSVPVEVLDSTGNAPLSGVIGITAGQNHACAVTRAGAALCWGDNSKNELGNTAASSQSNLPVPVSGLPDGVVTLAAGSYFTCGVTSSSHALCWGEGAAGQLGNGRATPASSPVYVLNSSGDEPLSGVVALSAGSQDACALTLAGTALCWGDNSSGQLGNGAASAQSSLPVEVLDSTGNAPLAGVVAISPGGDHTCAVTALGAAMCWGNNAEGELGSESVGGSLAVAPVSVSGLASGVAGIAAGDEHSCAVTSDGTTMCWGRTGF
jgi:alpha-tubulin suppressor-like RCC1 family protein